MPVPFTKSIVLTIYTHFHGLSLTSTLCGHLKAIGVNLSAVNFCFTIEIPRSMESCLNDQTESFNDVQHSTGSRSLQDRLGWPNLGYAAIRLSVPLAIPFLLPRSSAFVHSSVRSRHRLTSHIYPSSSTREKESPGYTDRFIPLKRGEREKKSFLSPIHIRSLKFDREPGPLKIGFLLAYFARTISLDGISAAVRIGEFNEPDDARWHEENCSTRARQLRLNLHDPNVFAKMAEELLHENMLRRNFNYSTGIPFSSR